MIVKDIENIIKQNTYFRKVLHTGKHCQIVIMSIPVNDEIGAEVHPQTDQIIEVLDGYGEAEINSSTHSIEDDDLIFIPAGSKHNIKNTGDEELKLLSIYAPSEHPEGTIHKTKEEAVLAESEE